MLRVDPARLDAYTRELRQAFRNEFVNVRSWKSTESDIGEDLERSENYLSLVGLVVLVLGGIGVSSVTRVFVEQKLKSIAVLKCVGAPHRADPGRLHAAGAGAGAGGQPARRGAGATGAGGGDPLRHQQRRRPASR